MFPASENVHSHHILDYSIVPARIDPAIQSLAQSMARNIAGDLDVVGLIAVEFFLTRDNELMVNELAPRPHNSGHYTVDACLTSQFEQQLRAVCGLPFRISGPSQTGCHGQPAGRPLESRGATRLAADLERPLRKTSLIRETGRSSWTQDGTLLRAPGNDRAGSRRSLANQGGTDQCQ